MQRDEGEPRAPRDATWAARAGAPLAPVIAVVVNHVPGGWSCARSLDDLFDPALRAIPGLAPLLPRFSILVEDLACRSDADLRASSLGVFQQLALWLLRDARDPVTLLNSFDAWAPAMLQVEQGPSGSELLLALFTYMFRVVDPMHVDDLRAKLRRLSRRAEETAMTIADYYHEEGRQEGRVEGRQKGRQEGRLAMLRSLLLVKFRLPSLDERYEARLCAATPEMLDHLAQRVLVVDTLDALFVDSPSPSRLDR